MKAYIVIADQKWFNDDTFETLIYPTIQQIKMVKGEIIAEDHIEISLDDYELLSMYVGKIYYNGEFYHSPEEIV